MRCIDTCRRTSRVRWHLVTASPVLGQGEGSPRRHDDAVSGRPTRDRQHDAAHSIRRRGSRTTAGRDSVSLDLRRVSPVARGSPAPGDARQIETSGSAGCSAGRRAPNSGGWGEKGRPPGRCPSCGEFMDIGGYSTRRAGLLSGKPARTIIVGPALPPPATQGEHGLVWRMTLTSASASSAKLDQTCAWSAARASSADWCSPVQCPWTPFLTRRMRHLPSIWARSASSPGGRAPTL